MGYDVHQTVFESRQEREADGRQVDAPWLQESNMVAGMGGLGHQDFSSLADDQDRRDMMNPAAIMGNMQMQGQIMGQGMQRQAIEAGMGGGGGNRHGGRMAAITDGDRMGGAAGQMVPMQSSGG